MRLLQYEIYNLVQDGTSEWWKNRQQSFHTELDYFFYYYKKAGRWNEFKAVVTSAISSPLILDNFATTRGIMVTKTKKLLICRLFHHNDAHLTLPLSAPDKGWERLWFLLLTHFLMNSMCADERWRTRKKKEGNERNHLIRSRLPDETRHVVALGGEKVWWSCDLVRRVWRWVTADLHEHAEAGF